MILLMWNLKTPNKTKQKQTYRHRGQTDGCQRGGGRRNGGQGEGNERYKPPVTTQKSWGYVMYSIGKIVNIFTTTCM